MQKKSLALLTRAPTSPMTGRKVVLRCALEMMVEHGYEVDVLYFGRDSSQPFASGTPLPLPGAGRVMVSAIESLKSGKSLNESAYWSAQAQEIISERLARTNYDLVYCDMLRTAQYVAGHARVLLDLDDLLSRRYEELASQESEAVQEVLGYYGERLPKSARAAFAVVAKWVVGLEAKRIAARELFYSERAAVVSLVSQREAESLSKISGRSIVALPMYVDLPDRPWRHAEVASGTGGVFLGGTRYLPNRVALREYHNWRGQDGSVPKLAVIGDCPGEHRSDFPNDLFDFRGYVDDVAGSLRGYSFFVAPITSGSGIKTKVLEAMALGMPVLATAKAMEGLSVTDGVHYLQVESARSLLSAIEKVASPELSCAIGAAAREFVTQNFSRRVLSSRWRDVLTGLERQQHCEANTATDAAAEPSP